MATQAYILSAGHSGSTLLNLLLGAHSEIAAVSELINLPTHIPRSARCTCGEAVAKCIFWKEVSLNAKPALGFDFIDTPFRLNLGFLGTTRFDDTPWNRHGYRLSWKFRHGLVYLGYRFNTNFQMLAPKFHQSIVTTEILYSAIRKASGCSIVVDASKIYMKGLGCYRRSPQVTKLILLIRDGRGTYYSHLKRGQDRSRSMFSWLNYYSRAISLLEVMVDPDDLVIVRYEQLVSDPTAELTRICSALGIEFQPAMLQPDSSCQHSIGGNNMRFLDGGLKIRVDESWRQNLSADDLAYFEDNAGWLNERLGYK